MKSTPLQKKTRIAVFALSERGGNIGETMRQGLLKHSFEWHGTRVQEITVHRWLLYGPNLSQMIGTIWKDCSAIIMIMATGIAVRTIAPLLQSKRVDPAIVVVDEAAKFAVSLAGGHLGGANQLAEKIGDILGAQPIVTTASERLGLPALDLWAREQGLEAEDATILRRLSAALVRGEEIVVVNLPPDREAPFRSGADDENTILITDRSLDHLESNQALAQLLEKSLILRPKIIFAGIGCRRGTTLEALEEALRAALSRARICERSVACLASIDRKSDEPALLALANQWNVPVCFYTAEELEAVRPPNPSSFVREEVGAWGVAEPAAILAAGSTELLLEKTVFGPVTVALTRGPWPSLDWAPGMRPV